VAPAQTADVEVPATLASELVQRLAYLADLPDGAAEVVLSTVGYGSRCSLIEHDIIEPVQTAGDSGVVVKITENGWGIISACAADVLDDDENGIREAERRLAEGRREHEAGEPRSASTSGARDHREDNPVGSLSSPDLKRFLGLLWQQPRGVAVVMLSAVSSDWLEELMSQRLIEDVPTRGDHAVRVQITQRGWEAIKGLAEQSAEDPAREEAEREAALERLEHARRERT
jgi:hypothetical protein